MNNLGQNFNNDMSIYDFPTETKPLFVQPTWLNHLQEHEHITYGYYIEFIRILFSYIITNNKLLLTTQLHVNQGIIFKAIDRRYTSNKINDVPTRNSLPTTTIKKDTQVESLEAVWFAKESHFADSYSESGMVRISRTIFPLYKGMNTYYGVNMFLSFDSNPIRDCSGDLFLIDSDLINHLHNLIMIKIKYLTDPSDPSSRDPQLIDQLDSVFKLTGDGSNYSISNIFNPNNRVPISQNEINEAYGLIDGKRNSDYVTDIYLMYQINEILYFIQSIIRNQPRRNLNNHIYSMIQNMENGTGVCEHYNPVHILGCYESNTSWGGSEPRCTLFAAELTISGYFLNRQINNTLNFLYDSDYTSLFMYGGKEYTTMQPGAINTIKHKPSSKSKSKKNKSFNTIIHNSHSKNTKKYIMLIKNKSKLKKYTKKNKSLKLLISKQYSKPKTKSFNTIIRNTNNSNKRYTLDEINDYLFSKII